jgi:predicted ribosome quality control (RQC) complex YloA/Tae2 family protein
MRALVFSLLLCGNAFASIDDPLGGLKSSFTSAVDKFKPLFESSSAFLNDQRRAEEGLKETEAALGEKRTEKQRVALQIPKMKKKCGKAAERMRDFYQSIVNYTNDTEGVLKPEPEKPHEIAYLLEVLNTSTILSQEIEALEKQQKKFEETLTRASEEEAALYKFGNSLFENYGKVMELREDVYNPDPLTNTQVLIINFLASDLGSKKEGIEEIFVDLLGTISAIFAAKDQSSPLSKKAFSAID